LFALRRRSNSAISAFRNAESFFDGGKGGKEVSIGELTPGCFGERNVGGRGGDRAEVGGRIFLAQAFHRFFAKALEIGGQDGDVLARKSLAQLRGFVGHFELSTQKSPGRFRARADFPL
jgi:hypothetical protein